MNGMASNPQFMIQDLASNNLQILDYRSKRNISSFEQGADDVAYLIHNKMKIRDNYYYYGKQFNNSIISMYL